MKDGAEEKSTLTPEAAKSEPEAVETKLEPKAKTKSEVEIAPAAPSLIVTCAILTSCPKYNH